MDINFKQPLRCVINKHYSIHKRSENNTKISSDNCVELLLTLIWLFQRTRSLKKSQSAERNNIWKKNERPQSETYLHWKRLSHSRSASEALTSGATDKEMTDSWMLTPANRLPVPPSCFQQGHTPSLHSSACSDSESCHDSGVRP